MKKFVVGQLISVVIPVYNVQRYIGRCLESVLSNSYSNLEIICIDDGSTDDSLQILRSYEKKDSRVQVFTKDNGGVSQARNEGLKHCTGEFVAFIDADDWIHKEYFSTLLKFQKNKYEVVVCNYVRTKGADECDEVVCDVGCKFKVLTRKEYMSAHVTKTYVWGKLFKRDCLQGILFDETEKIEDEWFNLEFVSKNPDMKCCFVDIPLYYYYICENSLMNYIDRFCILKLAKKCFEYAVLEKDIEMREILYLESLKRALSARYDFALRKDKIYTYICWKLLKDCVKQIKKDKKIYITFVYCPWGYRVFRLINDPTMLQYEKKVREEYRLLMRKEK